MTKNYSILLLIIAFACVLLSCSKEEDSAITTRSIQSTNDELLLMCLNDTSMDCYEKGALFLDQDTLSEEVISELLIKSEEFDPFVIEIILTSQYGFTDNSFASMIDCKSICDLTIENILLSQTPLTSKTIEYLYRERNMVLDHKYDNLTKIVSACDGGVIYTEKYIEIFDCLSGSIIAFDSQIRPFINNCHCNDENIQKLLSGSGSDRWAKGEKKLDPIPGGQIVKCKRPPEPKCFKRPKESISELSKEDQQLIDLINSKETDFEIGKKLLDQDTLSEIVLIELFKKSCDFDKFVMQTVFLTQGKLTEKTLVNILLNENLSADEVTQILVVNTPLDENIIRYLKIFQPEIPLNNITNYNDKSILFSMCDQSLLVGDSIIIDTDQSFTIYNMTEIKIPAPITQENKMVLANSAYSKKWIYGERDIISSGPNTDAILCLNNPDIKCVKVAKMHIKF